jgi:hypothetical protein
MSMRVWQGIALPAQEAAGPAGASFRCQTGLWNLALHLHVHLQGWKDSGYVFLCYKTSFDETTRPRSSPVDRQDVQAPIVAVNSTPPKL